MSSFILILMESLKLPPINGQPASQAAAAAVYMSGALPIPTLPFPSFPSQCFPSYVANSDTEVRPQEFRRH